MSSVFPVDHKVVTVGTLAATGVMVFYSTWKYLSMDKTAKRKNVYETETYLNQYLLFHYGNKMELSDPWMNSIDEKFLYFPKRVSELCIKHSKANGKALDIGCAVGRSSFELARHYRHVLGMDYSKVFVETCRTLKEKGSLMYYSSVEGDLTDLRNAEVDPSIDRGRTEFQHGDACSLPLGLGQFDCVLASNIICRLRSPKNFLDKLEQFVAPNGILVIALPYSFSTFFTPRENWIGGWKTDDGNSYTGFDGIRSRLCSNFDIVEDLNFPMMIRETKWEYQLTFSHVQVWRRKQNGNRK